LNEFPGSSLASLSPGQPLVIDGYTLRILTAQGDEVPGGAISYIVNGKMTGGFAVLATPVKYAETGITTFMTGSDGAVYERARSRYGQDHGVHSTIQPNRRLVGGGVDEEPRRSTFQLS
jgi:hypothetical protein